MDGEDCKTILLVKGVPADADFEELWMRLYEMCGDGFVGIQKHDGDSILVVFSTEHSARVAKDAITMCFFYGHYLQTSYLQANGFSEVFPDFLTFRKE